MSFKDLFFILKCGTLFYCLGYSVIIVFLNRQKQKTVMFGNETKTSFEL